MKLKPLLDLDDLITQCKTNYQNIINKGDIHINSELATLLERYLKTNNDPQINVLPYSIEIINKDNLKALLPSTWLWMANCFWPLVSALEDYQDHFNTIKSMFKARNNLDDIRAKKFFKYFPLDLAIKNVTSLFDDDDPENRYIDSAFREAIKPLNDEITETKLLDYKESLDTIIQEIFTDPEQYKYFRKFIYDRNWWFKGNGKTLDRTDYCESSLLLAANLIVANSSKFYLLTSSFAKNEDLRKCFSCLIENAHESSETNLEITSKSTGENIIYYGAPGTGKSHEINELTKINNYSVRTVFHPDTQYSDFVGCLRPSMGSDGIEYSYKHGPFIEALVKALNDPENHYYLIIEELNRAPAAAVFGEIFQLLDRKDGQSQYKIDINDKDLLMLLNMELSSPLPDNKLYIPKNLSIYATMNSSDQAVMPLDTAFKRRWKFEYKPISFEDKNGKLGCPKGTIGFQTKNGFEPIEWAVLAQTINKILSSESIPEDRHLGPWFINKDELGNPDEAQKCFTGKILMYLWDDVLRHGETSKLFHKDIKTFGGLISAHKDKKQIFSEEFYLILEKTYPIMTATASTTSSDEVQEENTVDG